MKFVRHCNELMEQPPVEIMWCYSEFQPAYTELMGLPNVQLIEGLPDLEALKADSARPKLIIFDDMMTTFAKDPSLVTLFVKGCHHWQLSCIHITQNLYFNGLRTARINADYLALFKNPSDKLQIQNLGRQLFPGKAKFFVEAFEMATVEPYTYLLIDLTQKCPDILRLRSNVFPGELMAIFVQK